MKSKNKLTALAIATAAAGMFALAPVTTLADSHSSNGEVKCMGANACKGTSACKTANNACKGQNSCKGTGFIMSKTEKDCTDKGGTVASSDADNGTSTDTSTDTGTDTGTDTSTDTSTDSNN